MYVITKNAAWWAGPDSTRASGTQAEHPEFGNSIEISAHLPDRATRWAAVPLKLQTVTCFAARSIDGVVQIYAQRKGKREWLPAFAVLTAEQLQGWLQGGFVKAR